MRNSPLRLTSSLHLLIIITLAAFTVEVFIMLTLRSVMPGLGVGAEAILDSALLVALLLPALYLFMVRPLELQIASRRSAEERLANILDTAADAIIIFDADFRITLFNQGAQQLYGYYAREATGQSIDLLLPERFREMQRQRIYDFGLSPETALRLGERRPVFGRRKDGSEFPAEASVSKLIQGGKLTFTAIVHDLTRLKRAEEALHQTNEELELRVRERTTDLTAANEALQAEIAERERAEAERERLLVQVEQARQHAEALARTLKEERDALDTIMENTHTHLAYLDSQFNFVLVNSTYCRGSGYGKEALLGHNHFELFPHPENLTIFKQVRDTGQPIEFLAKPFEFPDQPERGVTYWDWTLAPVKDGEGQVQGLVLSLMDVTELRRARDGLEQRVQERTTELAQANAALRAGINWRERIEDELRSSEELFRQLAENIREIFWVASPEGGQIIYVSPAYEILWGRTRESLYQNSSSFIEAVIPEDRARIAAIFGTKTEFEVECRITNPAGSIRWIRVRGFPIQNVKGVVYRVAGIAEDVTERILAYQLLEQRVQERTIQIYEQAQHLVALEERQHLARELHDSLSQSLYGVALGAHTALTFLDSRREKVVEALNYVISLADAGLTEMRALIFDLRPESLEVEGLANALLKQAAALRARYDIAVNVETCDEPDAPLETKEAVYRIAQEALHNAVKHAQPDCLRVWLCGEGGNLVLEINDNGIGFDPTKLYAGHLGLNSMRERAHRLGGKLNIQSAPGSGTCVRAEFPLNSRMVESAL